MKAKLVKESLNNIENLKDYSAKLWDELSTYLSPNEMDYWKGNTGNIDYSIKEYFRNDWTIEEAGEHLYKRMGASGRFESEGKNIYK